MTSEPRMFLLSTGELVRELDCRAQVTGARKGRIKSMQIQIVVLVICTFFVTLSQVDGVPQPSAVRSCVHRGLVAAVTTEGWLVVWDRGEERWVGELVLEVVVWEVVLLEVVVVLEKVKAVLVV